MSELSPQNHQPSDSNAHASGLSMDTSDGVQNTIADGDSATESSDDTSRLVTVNIILVVLFGIFALWGGSRVIQQSQGFDPLAYNPYRAQPEGPIEPPSLFEIGQKVYSTNCAACHQAGGNGVSGAFPTLHGTKWVTGNRTRLVNIILGGLAGPLEVNGESYNGNMPAWQNQLSDNEIAGVITYIRNNEEWGNKAGEVTEEEVAQVKAEYGGRSNSWSAEELLEQFPDGAGGESNEEETDEENGADDTADSDVDEDDTTVSLK